MVERPFLTRALRALGVVLVVCIGVRLGSWLIQPVLPALAVGVLLALLIQFVVRSPHSRF